MSTATYPVTGMTCAHCVASVTEEVAEVPGVTDVAVDLEAGYELPGDDWPVVAPAARLTAED